MIIYALIAAAIAALFVPWKKGSVQPASLPFDLSSVDAVPAKPVGIAYLDAVASLQTVQRRLIQTGQLDEEQRVALDTLTLALSAASEQ